jgi:hypothetical protein
VTRWLALAIAIGTLFLASWIFLPAPTYFFLTFSVGAPEVSAWLVLASLVGLGVASVGCGRLPCRKSQRHVAVALIARRRRSPDSKHLRRVPRDASAPASRATAPQPLVIADLFAAFHSKRRTGDARDSRRVSAGKPLTLEVYQPFVEALSGDRADLGAHGAVTNQLREFRHVDREREISRHRHRLSTCTGRTLARAARRPESGAGLDRITRASMTATGKHRVDGPVGRAHLALLAAYTSGHRCPRRHQLPDQPSCGRVSQSAAPDPITRLTQETFVGALWDADAVRRGVAVSYVRPGLPPTLLVYGARDNIVGRNGARLRSGSHRRVRRLRISRFRGRVMRSMKSSAGRARKSRCTTPSGSWRA